MRLETEQQIKDFCAEQALELKSKFDIFQRLWMQLGDEWIADIIADAVSRWPDKARIEILAEAMAQDSYFSDGPETICCERWIDDAIAARNEPSQGDINREAAARDNQQRREDLKREVA